VRDIVFSRSLAFRTIFVGIFLATLGSAHAEHPYCATYKADYARHYHQHLFAREQAIIYHANNNADEYRKAMEKEATARKGMNGILAMAKEYKCNISSYPRG
jgi:hypothetical protein